MRRLRALLLRVYGLFRARQFDRDLRREIASHLEEAAAEYRQQGLSPTDARTAALRSFGGVAQTEEAHRDARSFAWLDNARRDLHYAFRSLRRAPGFAVATIATLALGIGANATVFSAVYAALLKPVPYERPDEVFSVEVVIPDRQTQIQTLPVRAQDYMEWRRATTIFSAVAALAPVEWNLAGGSEPQRVGGARVSANFFSFLGVPVAHGREFLPEEEVPGRDGVVVISDALWRSRYGASLAVLNSRIVLNDTNYLVVGIASPSLLVPVGTTFHPLLTFAPSVDIWQPIAPTPRDLQGENWNYGLLVRVPAGQRADQGQLQLQTLLNASLRAQLPDLKIEVQTKLVPIREIYAGRIRLALLLVSGAAGLLLLAACASTANLYLGRIAGRSQEFVLRLALGASRSQVLAQVLTESVCLALIAGVGGIALAYAGTGLLLAQGPRDVQVLAHVRPTVPVLILSALTSLLTGVVCGVLPAWQAHRRDACGFLQKGWRNDVGGGHAAKTRQVLVAIEIALSTALLASAALLLHSFVNVMQADRGYEVERVLALDLAPGGQRYASDVPRIAYYRDLLDEVRSTPGVVAAGAVNRVPALAQSGTQTIYLPGDVETPELTMRRPVAGLRSATPGYFAASGTALRAGRPFNEQESTPVAVISESLGRALWPGQTPQEMIGRGIAQGGAANPACTVIGVVEDARSGDLDRELPPQLYRPHRQLTMSRMTVVVRTAQDPASVAASLRSIVRQHDPTVPIVAIRTMREIVSASLAQRRFQMALLLSFGVVALLIGAVGVYGVVNYSVARRTRDIGLRIALGALPQTVVAQVISEGMRPVVIGLCAGLLGAVALARALRHLLFGVGPLDPIALGGVVLLLVMTAALACYLPAKRASQLDPLTALRQE
jgi:putative ABC transport system permease protein